ncbi:MAG: type II toxin-antitoxin system RelE/ParE family toxin [Deltaproteobacteria bacterium]|nr:type II toxin-antitoxin system RelE/ParE family toxin [Deltaproteobacteria bacterium]
MGQLRWTEKASKNLQALFDYISKDFWVYAARYVKALINSTTKLEKMPRCGRTVPELDDPRFREVLYGNHRIVYRIIGADDNIEILAVIHGAREMKGTFQEEWELV